MSPDDPTQHFYETPNPVKEEPSTAGIDLPLTRARSVTLNHAVAFTAIMLTVLSLALWLVLQERPVKRLVESEQQLLAEGERAEALAGETNGATRVSDQTITLYDGPYILDFMPGTKKKEGLSLFYVINNNEVPRSDFFKVRADVLTQNKADALAESSFAGGERPRDIQVPAARETGDDAVLSRSDVYLKIARRNMESQKYDKAAVTLERLIGMDGEHLEAKQLLLQARIKLMDHKKAIALFEELDALGVLTGADVSDYGVILATTGQFDNAQEILERAYILSGQAIDPSINYALNSMVLSQWGQAIEVLEHLLERYPDHSQALGHLAYARLGDGQYGAARAAAKQYLRLEPQSIDPQLILAETYAMERNVASAVDWLSRVRSQVGLAEFAELVNRPAFQRISDRPEFQALLQ